MEGARRIAIETRAAALNRIHLRENVVEEALAALKDQISAPPVHAGGVSLVAESLPAAITTVVSVTSMHVAIAADTVATIAVPVAVSSVDGRRANTTVRAADHGNVLDV